MEIKGILHAHSNYSYDAKLSLRELRDMFVSNSLQFACMTEHTDELTPERAAAFVEECDKLSNETFRFIPGFEVPYQSAHILMIGMRTFREVYAPTIDVLKQWTDVSPFVVLAHPVRNDFKVSKDLCAVIDALEVWNQQYDGKRVPRLCSLALFTELRAQKPTLVAVGGVDLHRKEHMGAPIITLQVEECTERHIIARLREGSFVISSTQSHFYGMPSNIPELVRAYRFQSHVSVGIIILGKVVNKMLAYFGISLPRSLKQMVRKRI